MNKLDSRMRLPPASMPHGLATPGAWHRLLAYELMRLDVSELEIISTCTSTILVAKNSVVASRFYSVIMHPIQAREETSCCAKLTRLDGGCFFRLLSKVVFLHATAI